jgi:predicted DsbA family dithiol-disulfide isomerase
VPILEEAVRRFGARVDVQWHAYELRPEPAPLPDPEGDYIAEHWRNRVLPMAEERGLVMKPPHRQIRSRRALQAALFAREQGRLPQLDRLLFRARFEHDADISDISVLKELGAAAGLDAEALAYAVTSDSYVDALQHDITRAHRLGVQGVPVMFVGTEDDDDASFFANAEPVVGAVPYDWLSGAIERALAGDRTVAEQRTRFRARWKIG